MIQPELDNGEVTTAPSKIGRNAMSYFSDLFAASPYHLDANLFDTIDPCISDEEDQSLHRLPTIEEVWEAI